MPYITPTEHQDNLLKMQQLEETSAALLEALEALFEHCSMVHKHWGEGSNQKQADEAIAAAIAAIQKAEGE